ncbi:MAG TPA: hypothetical protein PLG59_15390 [bacterium]|nr:hypothetical protein [bacterium]HQO36046.1 hypothetical protein [bacterium]HQQ00794.1 hypothetical protein [bacterium]
MLEANSPRGQIDRTDLKNAWIRMVVVFFAALLVFIDQMIPGVREVIQSIDFDSTFGNTLGPLITSAILAAITYGGTLLKGFLTNRSKSIESSDDGGRSVSGTGS